MVRLPCSKGHFSTMEIEILLHGLFDKYLTTIL